ncbi:hypothetical protein DSAG12_02147 [Promethearchaeum syntrophicum]|uniref:Uncharacterized protein n=1 Tax=Promethearchaeum syntrophicum TaxID=2594042 RepID=A0A5B9DBT5_9ARCH|nr:hypothetical protein [Candidatus Prometheoarchaeum syntrophicum]QEE16317.1 hypothetical protein DSAG12_02147 [Candidatus Prometheoarchaeum syntrophicum]
MESTLRSQTVPINPREIKKHSVLSQKCPICKQEISFGVEHGFLEKVERYPYPHVILHGDPLHALIVYIDADFLIRGADTARSIEIHRNSNTFSQIIKKWSNPY